MTDPRFLASVLDDRGAEIAAAVVARHYELVPSLEKRFGPAGRAHCLADAQRHLSYLTRALSSNEARIWLEYLAWGKVLLSGYGVPAEDLATNLECLRTVLVTQFNDAASPAVALIDEGLAKLGEMPTTVSPFTNGNEPFGDLAMAYVDDLMAGRRNDALRRVEDQIAAGASLKDIYLHVFQPSQYEIGRRWQMNQLTVAQEHYCTAATQLIMSQLYHHLFTGEPKDHVVLATCVAGDLHELGIRMVADFFEMEGWASYYYGANTPTAALVKAVEEHQPDVLAVSVTIAQNLAALGDLVTAVRRTPAGRDAIILCGGYPFRTSPNLYAEFGADGSADDALGAVELAERLVEERL